LSIALAGAVPATAAPANEQPRPRALATLMTGGQEVPAADPDGVGVAGVLISANRERICFALAVKNIGPANLAHIHVGAAGVNGPPVVLLDPPPTRGFSAACVRVDAEVGAAIADNPSGYYVNVHNEEFPAGAIRGQLH
jgi:hypothetical protein